MASIYTRKGNYKDTGAMWLSYLSAALVVAGLGLTLVSVIAVTDPYNRKKMEFIPHIYTGYVLFMFGIYGWKAAAGRAYGDRRVFSVRALGVLLIILQVLTVLDVVVLSMWGTVTFKDIVLCPIPAILYLPIPLTKCTRKARTISFLLVGYAALYLLTDVEKLIHEIPGKGLLSVVYALFLLLMALVLGRRVKTHLKDQDEASYF